jgi:NAD(P)-dependent dehydrogenase (short-subunit alcohol dehydrogenase family)
VDRFEGQFHKMRVIVIGGTGHIGSYLTPLLVEAGHSVTCVCRRALPSCQTHYPAWDAVSYVQADRINEEEAGTVGERIAAKGELFGVFLNSCTRCEGRQFTEPSPLRPKLRRVFNAGREGSVREVGYFDLRGCRT